MPMSARTDDPFGGTEALHPASAALDTRDDASILATLLDQQQAALAVLEPALPAIAHGAARMAATVRGGGRLAYAGAGSSGLMALADALELHGTFGLPERQIAIHMPGGLPRDGRMPGDTEDAADEGRAAGAALGPADCAICVAASGRTPYTLAFAEAARAAGAAMIAIANNADAPLFARADVAIALLTPAEIVSGSTRMGAGTAQKAALNLMSTLMGVRLGRVFDGMMVGLVADNAKLRDRAERMVAQIARVGGDAARAALEGARGDVRTAVLIARGLTPQKARAALERAGGDLRDALNDLND